MDEQVLQKPQVLNLVQAVNKINDVLGNKKCISLLETMGWVRPESSGEKQVVPTQQKAQDKPTRKVVQSPEKKPPKKDTDVIQVMSTSDVSDTSEDGLGHGSSEDSDNGCKAKKKGKKKKLKSGMILKAKDAGIKVKVKWAQSMLGMKKEVNFDEWTLTSLFLVSPD